MAIYSVECETCETTDIAIQIGAYFTGKKPRGEILADISKRLNLKEAVNLAKNHENELGKNHDIFVEPWEPEDNARLEELFRELEILKKIQERQENHPNN